jgi:tetratricopeptide (TPR) repeat protein
MGKYARAARTIAACTSFALLCGTGAFADTINEEALPRTGYCGSVDAEPFADTEDGKKQRVCEPAVKRSYTPKYKGIGFEALDLESEVCFVPDDAYRLLDTIIDTVTTRAGAPPAPRDKDKQVTYALAVSRITGEVLAEMGFGLYIPTETLADALVPRSAPAEEPRHTVDCDTSSLILLTIAETLGLPASLVEITLQGGAGHNFVRWQVDQMSFIDWDTNGRAQCFAPANSPSYQGKAMTHDQVISYLTSIRAALWSQKGELVKSLADYRAAIALFPEHPTAYNNFAWAVATKEFAERDKVKNEALGYADMAIKIERVPNFLDTVACMYAFTGDFAKAVTYQKEAIAGAPQSDEFRERLKWFEATPPRDCTGAK